jgi:hypothetical protein
MKISKILTAVFLSWTAIDLDLYREGARKSTRATEELLILGEDVVRKKKRVLCRRRTNAIPPWLRRAKLVLHSRVNHSSGRSRDPRDSDQRKIRRKFNNA